jgi:hypothetical protein
MNTLFSKREKPFQHVNEIAVYYMHVAAFFTYLIYFTWSVLAVIEAYRVHETDFFVWFALGIGPLSLGCALGCLFFYSRGARWEFTIAIMLVAALLVYLLYEFIHFGQNPTKLSQLTNAVLDLQFAVVPVLRILFIYFATLVAGKKRDDE